MWHGESLALWQELFPDGTIIGVDSDPRSTWLPGTHPVIMSQDDPRLPDLIQDITLMHGVDLIVDDASHRGLLTRRAHQMLWPLLRPGRYYVIEDWLVGQPWNEHYPHFDATSMADFAREFLSSSFGNNDLAEVRYVATGNGLIILKKA